MNSHTSIHFIVSSHRLKQDRIFAFGLNELKHDPQVVTRRARSRFRQLSLQFVGSQCRVKSILSQQFQSRLHIKRRTRLEFSQSPRCPNKSLRRNQRSLHRPINFMIAAGLFGFNAPSLNSARASFTASTTCARRTSATRRCTVAAIASCFSRDNSLTESNTRSNVAITQSFHETSPRSTDV